MTDTFRSQLIAEIARDLVDQIAPHELPLFRATSEAYFRRAARPLKGQGARDEMLGFGTGSEVTFLTPVVLATVHTVVDFIAAEMSASHQAANAGVAAIRSAFRTYRSAEPTDRPAPPLTAAQIAQARQLVVQKASQFKLAAPQAELLANSLVGSMAGANS